MGKTIKKKINSYAIPDSGGEKEKNEQSPSSTPHPWKKIRGRVGKEQHVKSQAASSVPTRTLNSILLSLARLLECGTLRDQSTRPTSDT